MSVRARFPSVAFALDEERADVGLIPFGAAFRGVMVGVSL